MRRCDRTAEMAPSVPKGEFGPNGVSLLISQLEGTEWCSEGSNRGAPRGGADQAASPGGYLWESHARVRRHRLVVVAITPPLAGIILSGVRVPRERMTSLCSAKASSGDLL
jgi:hypothetical protein